MRKEWALLAGSVFITLLLALGLIRWLAPQLLGFPADMQMVQLSDEVPAFYDNIFRKEDYRSPDFILKDPVVRDRFMPMYLQDLESGAGPHDLLGFRNDSIPNVADIVVIGDSQTYGNNVILGENWPNRLQAHLPGKKPVVYSMAVGGWGAIQYLDMLTKSAVFRPRLVIVAFYTGNDAFDSFLLAYNVEQWAFLRPDPQLDASDAPDVHFPPPKETLWRVRFADGMETTFSPAYRLSANRLDDPAVRAGYGIMWKVARLMDRIAEKRGVQLILTIIPTKELIHARKVEQDGLDSPQAYRDLISAESSHIAALSDKLKSLKYAHYVDLVAPMQLAALGTTPLYPGNLNGHPIVAGYDLIAREVAKVADSFLPRPVSGAVRIKSEDGESYRFCLVRDGSLRGFHSPEVARANGWDIEKAPLLEPRDVATLSLRGWIDTVDRQRFGPEHR